MNSEEAAASLFGSEDSGSDLFATLGAETNSPEPAQDNLFHSEFSLHGNQEDTFNFESDNQTYTESAGPFYPSGIQAYGGSVHEASNREPWSEVGNGPSGGPSGGVHGPRASNPQATHTTYSNHHAPSVHSAEPSAYTAYVAYNIPGSEQVAAQAPVYQNHNPPSPVHSYAPSSATHSQNAPTSAPSQSYTHYDNPTVANAHSKYGAYDPPTTATRSTYSAYDPPVLKAPPAPSYTPAYNPPAPLYDLSLHKPEQSATNAVESYHTKPNGQANTNPGPNISASTPKSTITRPKVSNAYDPPFPVTLPTRRGSRTTTLTAQQAYAQYQQPAEISHSTNQGTNQIVAHAQPSVQNDYNPRPSSAASNVHAVGAINGNNQHYGEGPSSEINVTPMSYPHSANDIPSADNLAAEIFLPAKSETETLASRLPEDSQFPIQSFDGGGSLATAPDKEKTLFSSPPSQKHVSPSSTPLPYSPLVGDSQDQHLPSGSDHSNKVGPYSYTAQHGTKKEFKDLHDPYAPRAAHSNHNYIPRTSSPLSLYNGRTNEPKKPAPSNAIPFGLAGKSLNTVLPPGNTYTPLNPSVDSQATSHIIPSWSDTKPQELMVTTTASQYAPSPSLIGANDPLSRTSARAPVVTFGFGGKMVTCFHGMPGLNAGFDVAFSSRTTSELKVRILHKTLPESAFSNLESSYPGPLLGDPGSASISLVRPNIATQTKTKKSSVLNYLAGRVSEIHQGLGYLSSTERRAAEDKLILVKLLSIMVENDGRLLGTTQAETAVRCTLVPRLEGTPVIQDALSIQASYRGTTLEETPLSVTTLKASSLDKIEEYLLRGDRRQAYQYAAEEKLWAHAMIIASSIDKDSWKEVVHDFLRTELAVTQESDSATHSELASIHAQKTTRESLRVAYSLFSGQGPASIQEMAPLSLLQRGLGRFQSPLLTATTPRTPNFAAMQQNTVPPAVPSASLAKWAETVAMIMSSPLTPEASAALTALGDQLIANNWVEAAHVCYLLSPQTSLIGGLGSPTTKLTLVGSKNPANVMKDPDALIFSEILEFALSLVPVAKGQESFHGIPHLQAYRLVKTVTLAEVGEVQLANRYCEAITSCLSQTSPYTNIALLEQLQGLQQRLSGVFPGDKGGSWIGGKIGKPSLDSIGGWLEGRFTKLVTGESEGDAGASNQTKVIDQPFAGPFAHYSNISSTTPSARSSPQPQMPPPSNMPPPPQRTSSAMATATPYSQHVHVERSSSAMDHVRLRPVANAYMPNSYSLSTSQSSPMVDFSTQPDLSNAYAAKIQDTSPVGDEIETPVQTSWWGASHSENESSTTPTAATFLRVDESTIQPSNEGFISLMDNHAYSVGPSRPSSQTASPAHDFDDDDDLGLGNSKPKPRPPVSEREDNGPPKGEPTSAPKETPAAASNSVAPPAAAASSSSWLGRWFKRSEPTGPGPIKASLGEESAFYYDKEQKRWVNRKAGAAEADKPATPPPPPSRAQTASPGMTGSAPHPAQSNTPPPLRSASAVELTEPPTKAPMRIRSNLAPPMESAPSTPTGTRLNPPAGPPPPRPKSQATKRNVRSRYVDVFQQEGATS